jgi:hypothetical protein
MSKPEARSAAEPIAVDETACAAAIGMSVAWLRKDRRTARVVPFYRLGGSVRYNLIRVREALAAVEEGGARRRPKGAP